MRGHLRWLIVILVVTVAAVWMSLPENPGIHLNLDDDPEPEIDREIEVRPGLDLQGGLRVLLAADLPAGQVTGDDMQAVRRIIENRVNALGVVEPVIQLQEGTNRIVVELPGITNPDVAISTIRETGLLEFVDFSGISNTQAWEGVRVLTTAQLEQQQAREDGEAPATAEAAEATEEATEESTSEATAASSEPTEESTAEAAAEATAEATAESTEIAAAPEEAEQPPQVNPLTGQPFETVMTGSGLQSASAQLGQGVGNAWEVVFTLSAEGDELFGNFTASHIGQPLAIVLDGEVISAPTINDAIRGTGSISGSFTQEEAQALAVQLRYGALPVPLRIESTESVGPTLGLISVNRSIVAGIIGVITVLAFMLIYYRMPGIAADLALLIFIVLNFALFKFVPVTLTLPAIAGFLISIGTAVDGNILIFERMKEELRKGRSLDQAVIAGFDRAWSSIRDSNLSTIIICGVLYLFGSTFGASAVRGFAITLALGLTLNLFTAIIVTRTFLALILRAAGKLIARRPWLLGV